MANSTNGAEEIANTISGQNNIISEKRDLLCELLLHFENGVSSQLMVAEYFADKSKGIPAEPEPTHIPEPETPENGTKR